MPSVLKEKIAGMTPQAAGKLSRELQEVWKRGTGWEDATWQVDFPLLQWLVNALSIEGTVAEQIHLCDACRINNHKRHKPHYTDQDSKLWSCKCQTCLPGERE
jgi:hypothetical protein